MSPTLAQTEEPTVALDILIAPSLLTITGCTPFCCHIIKFGAEKEFCIMGVR